MANYNDDREGIFECLQDYEKRIIALEKLTTPTFKDSGGEERELYEWADANYFPIKTGYYTVRYWDESGKQFISENQGYSVENGCWLYQLAPLGFNHKVHSWLKKIPTPINPSEPEEGKDCHTIKDISDFVWGKLQELQDRHMKDFNRIIAKNLSLTEEINKFQPMTENKQPEGEERIPILANGETRSQTIRRLESELQSLKLSHSKLVDLLQECANQIEYLHGKFKETGSGNNVLSRIEQALSSFTDKEIKP